MPEFRLTARSGPTVFVAGLVGREPDGRAAVGLDRQVDRVFARLVAALAVEGLTPAHLVRLRIYLTDVTAWSTVVLPRLLAMVGDVVPPATVLGIAAMVEPWMEIEVDAEASTG